MATAQEEVLRALRTDLVSGHLAPGEQLIQESLAVRYGVSRVPLREALKILEAEGHVVYHPHRGYFVTTLSIDDLLEVYRLREILETEALEHAVPLLSREDCEALMDLAAGVDAAIRDDDVHAISEANRRFHFALFDFSTMPRLVKLIRQLWDATEAYRSVYFASEPNRHRVQDEHIEIVEALKRGDTGAAIRWHNIHRQNTISAVSAVIEQRNSRV